MKPTHLQNVRFDYIRYANCWEDADVLLEALQPNSTSEIISIGSAGDNCFALLTSGAKKVVAVDISPVQLYLIELKKVAFLQLDYLACKAFLGFDASENRTSTYKNKLQPHLSNAARNYWDNQLDLLKTGVIHSGKFEKYFHLFSKEALPNVQSKKNIAALFEQKTEDEQKVFHDTIWNTPEWEELYRHFFGADMLGEHGRDPEFLKHVTAPVGEALLAREQQHFRTVNAQQNYFLYYILYRRFPSDFLPFYMREENFNTIRESLHKLELHQGLLDTALDQHPNATHFNLSDIFEYMDDQLFDQITNQLIQKAANHAVFAYWNLLLPRRMSKNNGLKLHYKKALSTALKAKDLGYFYGDFIIEQKK